MRHLRTLSRYRYCATLLALLAMLMLFVGPWISQLEAAASGHGAHHTVASASHADMSDMASHHDKPPAAFTWHDQCGYCSLWQHFPMAHVAIPGVARDALKPRGDHYRVTRVSEGRTPVFPNALSRAPPTFS